MLLLLWLIHSCECRCNICLFYFINILYIYLYDIFTFIIFKTIKYENYTSIFFLIKNILFFSDGRKDNIAAHINIHLSVISFLLCISVKISGPSWAELTNGPVSYFMYEEPPGALSPTCPGVDPLVSMCERLFGKSGSFRGEGWFPWDALAKWGITYRCQCWAAIYPHTHRFRIWKPIYDEKTHASEKCCNLHDTGTFLRRFSHAPNCFIENLTEIP